MTISSDTWTSRGIPIFNGNNKWTYVAEDFFATATALCVFLYRFRKYWSKTIFTESTYLMSFSLALAIQVTEILKEVKPSRLSIIVLLMLSPSSGSWFPSFSTHALSVNTVTKNLRTLGGAPKLRWLVPPCTLGLVQAYIKCSFGAESTTVIILMN